MIAEKNFLARFDEKISSKVCLKFSGQGLIVPDWFFDQGCDRD
jgi:hypothetical protein